MIVLLWTDFVILGLLLLGLGYAWHVSRRPALRATWRRVFASPAAMGASVVLAAGFSLAVLDSLHFRPQLSGPGVVYDSRTWSVLDKLLGGLVEARETTYSAPLAWQGFAKDAVEVDGVVQRAYPRLQHGGAGLQRSRTRKSCPRARQRQHRHKKCTCAKALSV